MTLPNVLFQNALKAYRAGNKATARQLLIELLQGEPQNAHAWYWLSQATDNLDHKLAALEKAIHLKPDYAEAKAALEQARHHQIRDTLGTWHVELRDLYEEAKVAVQNGRYREALSLLKQLVQTNPEHEKGWLALSKLSANPELQIIALEKALDLNSKNDKAKTRLKTLRANHTNPLKLGSAFESVGEPKKALAAYKMAVRHARSATEHKEGKARQQRVRQKLKQKKRVRITTPTFTLMRMAAGPITLYLLLLLIQVGLNPLRIPVLLLLGALLVVMGSVLLTGIYLTPNHALMPKLMGTVTSTQKVRTAVFSFVGVFCIILPFIMLFIRAANRLEVLQAGLF